MPQKSDFVIEWDVWLNKLENFRQEFGHLNVPQKWEPDPGLARWVWEVRNQFHAIPLERLESLHRLGFDFGANRYWLARFFELSDFKRAHGHCNVPPKWKDNPQLGGWLSSQRQRQDSIPAGRRRLFESIGLEWDPLEAAWNRRYQELAAFKEKFGHCLVPGEWQENPQLGLWVSNQRNRPHQASPLHKSLLDQLGFDWTPAESVWKNHLEELADFRKTNGHCNVPPKYPPNSALGSWVAELRKAGRSKAPRHWRRKLDALQFEWAPVRIQQWELRFAELREFKQQFGHCRVPVHWPANPALGMWVGTQRQARDKLSRWHRRKLEKLGFEWQLLEMSPARTWEERFGELQEFHKRFGHCDVPAHWPENPPLREWAARQRSRDEPNLSSDQRRRLRELGFSWNLRETKWDRRFSELWLFWRKHRHCDVPRKWRENPGLRAWTLRQRYRKHTLGSDRIQKLESLGFRWLGPKRGRKRSPTTGRFVSSSGDSPD